MNPSLVQGHVFYDDRGKITYNNDLSILGSKRTYFLEGNRGFLRSYHGHKLESKIFQSVKGVARIILIKMDDPLKICSTFFLPDNGAMLFVPSGYYNGLQHLTDDNILCVYSDKSVEESQNDDYRLPWNAFGEELWSLTNYR